MSTNTAVRTTPIEKKEPRYVSFETFYKKYNDREDGYKYEWNNGIIEKTQSMKPIEIFIIQALTDFFYSHIKSKIGGYFAVEVEIWTSPTQFRKPDWCWFSKEQKKLFHTTTFGGPVPEFVVEIISKNDEINSVIDKVKEYFEAGVKVVWLIFPKQELVHVYNSVYDVTICENDTLCSAEKSIPGFVLPTSEIFKN